MHSELLISVLKLTSHGATSISKIAAYGHLTVSVAKRELKELVEHGLVSIQNDVVESAEDQRLKIAVKAVRLGVDIERVCRFLEWQEFENVAIFALESNFFETRRHFKFKWSRQWREIDVLGFRQPVILSVDCKHWRHSWQPSAMSKVVEAQIGRTKALSKVLLKIRGKTGIEKWESAELLPVVLTLGKPPFNFYKDVPVVPIFQFRSFINGLPTLVNYLAAFKVKLRASK